MSIFFAMSLLVNGLMFRRLWCASEGDALGLFFGAITIVSFALAMLLIAWGLS